MSMSKIESIFSAKNINIEHTHLSREEYQDLYTLCMKLLTEVATMGGKNVTRDADFQALAESHNKVRKALFGKIKELEDRLSRGGL